MKRVMLVMMMALSAMFLGACGGFEGDSGEVGLAESVKDALASKDMGSLYGEFATDTQNGMKLSHDRMVKRWDEASDKDQEESVKRWNKRIEDVDKDWEDLDFDQIKALSGEEVMNLSFKRYYYAKDFEERVEDLRVVEHSRGMVVNADWGRADITLRNSHGDVVEVELELLAGTWKLKKISIEGFDPEKKDDEDEDE